MDSGVAEVLTKMLGLLEQLSSERGVPNAESEIINKNVIKSENSPLDNDGQKPRLSQIERRRTAEASTIFTQIFFAYKRKVEGDTKAETLVSKINRDQQKTGGGLQQAAEKSGGGFFGKLLGGLSGLIGGIGGGGAIMAAAVPILAATIGIAAIILAAGKAFPWFVEGLIKMKDVDWESVREFADIMGDSIERLIGIYKDVIKFIAELAIDMIEDFVGLAVKTISDLGDAVKKYKDVTWEDLGKAAAAFGGFLLELTLAGFVAIPATLGAGVAKVAGWVTDIFPKLATAVRGFSGVTWEDLGKAGTALGGFLVALSAAGATAGLSILGSVVTTLGGGALLVLSHGMNSFTAASPKFIDEFKSFETIDGERLKGAAAGILAISAALGANALGGVITSIAGKFADFFGGDPMDDFFKLADKHHKFEKTAKYVTAIAEAFRKWSHVRTDDLAYNLKEINKAMDDFDPKKYDRMMRQIGYHSKESVAIVKLTTYLATGRYNGSTSDGIVETTHKILNELKLQSNALGVARVSGGSWSDMGDMLEKSKTHKNSLRKLEELSTKNTSLLTDLVNIGANSLKELRRISGNRGGGNAVSIQAPQAPQQDMTPISDNRGGYLSSPYAITGG